MARLVKVYKLLDPSSERPCGACGHAESHDETEYEDTHSRCRHRFVRKKACGAHGKRWRKDCDNCWSYDESCRCSEEDRLIADLIATNREKS